MTKTFSLFYFFLFPVLVIAQVQTYSGIVYDQMGMPLNGATVGVKGSGSKLATSRSGAFIISATPGDSLEISFTGYHTEVLLLGDLYQLVIRMKPATRSIEEVVVIGTRGLPRSKLASIVPVDVLDIKTIATDIPQSAITDILNVQVPSFSSTAQTVADGTDHIDPATVRGLGADQTLVLINGKRRYTTALVNVNSTMGRGAVGTDLNAIPTEGIERIELLRDGSAAQYGSDAIAGVINMQLNTNVNKGRAIVNFGENISTFLSFTHDHPGNFVQGIDPLYVRNRVVDGQRIEASVNYGFQIGKTKESFLNFTLHYDHREPALRSGERTGDLDNRTPGDQASNALLTQLGVTRRNFRMRVGQAKMSNLQGVLNGAVKLKGGQEFYFFSILGQRNGNSSGVYRLPYQNINIPAIYPKGFLPEISSDIQDLSACMGIKGKWGDWKYDFSNVYGQNSFSFQIENSLNVSSWYNSGTTKTTFDAGTLRFRQNTTNFDISRSLTRKGNNNLAFGAEYRFENYSQQKGEEASWANYMRRTNGQLDVYGGKPTTTLLADNTVGVPAGACQVFPGFRPDNSLSENRRSAALYTDIELEPVRKILMDAALRYENYSDFGSNLSGKLAGRLKVGDRLFFRGSASTGFRAPSLQQRFLTKTSTVFQAGVAVDDAILPNNSVAAQLLGIPSLRPEISTSFSLGLTYQKKVFSFTIDGYTTKVRDRIILTDAFQGKNGGTDLEQQIYDILLMNNASRGIFMANATDLRTSGIDAIFSWNIPLTANKSLRIESANTFTKRYILGATKVSEKLIGRESTYMSPINKAILVDGNPKVKSSLLFTYHMGRFKVYLRNTYFGKVTHVDAGGAPNWFYVQQIGGAVITDLSAGFRLSSNVRVSVGVNNLFDVYADKLLASKGTYKRLDVTLGSPTYDRFVETQSAQERGIVTNNTVTFNNQFTYSRRVTQFGMNGRYCFARIQIDF